MTGVEADRSASARWPGPARAAILAYAHLAALSAFAVAQPLFDILGRYPEFFAVRASSPREIVTFALAVTLGPPTALALVVGLAALAARSLGRLALVLCVGALLAVVALHVLKRADLPTGVTLALAAACGAAGALAYARTAAARTALTVLSPAPVVLLALLLVFSPVSRLVRPPEVRVVSATAHSGTPVVLVVFDELSTVSLLDERGRIDAGRFPNFARLARHGRWYRDATTVHPHTEVAVPAILDGRLPRDPGLPVLADHPRNLFTLLGRSHRMTVMEILTHLCPRSVCSRAGGGSVDDTAYRRAESVFSDAGIVYLHVVLPPTLAERLPPITETWTNFARSTDAHERRTGRFCGRRVCRFARLLRPGPRPSLSFLHAILPHAPWHFLPSGERYPNADRRIPGLVDGHWARGREWLARQGYQRYLLQLGYTDRALGVIMRRLEAQGLYDRSLVVVTADHGVSFRAGHPRRAAGAANLDDIAFVPLLVKPPHERRGQIVDGLARTVDILPTIADAAGVPIPWRVDGRSLLRTLPPDGDVVVWQHGGPVRARLSALRRARAATLRRQVALFGTASFERVYRTGPSQDLVGRRVAKVGVAGSGPASAEVDGGTVLRVDRGAGVVPAWITGRIAHRASVPPMLALALDGTVAAVTRSYEWRGAARFSAVLPPDAFHPGDNRLEVFAVEGTGSNRRLVPLTVRTPAFSIARRNGRDVLRHGRRKLRITPGAISGSYTVRRRPDGAHFSGWSLDQAARRPAELVVAFVDGRYVYSAGASTFDRRDIARTRGIVGEGFRFELPLSVAGEGEGRLRVFAVRGARASELPAQGGGRRTTD